MERIFIRVIDMPLSIRAYTSMDAEGNYNIYLNAGLSPEMQKKAYEHELMHIKRDDFSDKKTVQEAENF